MEIFNKKGVSVIEYALLFVIVIGAFIIMSGYIQRGTNGKWAQAGQSFAYGRQYDPQKTVECAFDDVSNQWYDHNCYEYYTNVKGCNNASLVCDDGTACSACGQCADGTVCSSQACEECVVTQSCVTSSCSQIQ